MATTVKSVRMIQFEGGIAPADLANAIMHSLVEMQGGPGRSVQIEIVKSCLRGEPLTKEHKVALENAVGRRGQSLTGNWLPLVRYVIQNRIANEQKCHLHATEF